MMNKADWQAVIDNLKRGIAQMERNLEINKHFLITAKAQWERAAAPPEAKEAKQALDKDKA